MKLRPAIPGRLSVRIQLVSAAVLLLFGGGAGFAVYTLHRHDLLAELEVATTAQGALLEQGLRHSMLTRDPKYLDELLHELGREPGVERVLLLDRLGEVRFASDSALVGTRMSRDDPGCRLCHDKAPADRGKSTVFRAASGNRILRNVNPVRNAPECHGCHARTISINGVLLIDHSLAAIDSRLRAQAVTFGAGTLAAMAVLGAGLGFLLHRLVVRPVNRMRRAMAEVEQGDFGRSLVANSGDEMSHLAEQYNRMATSLNDTMVLLRKREEYLAGILGSADDGMVVVDRELRIVMANPAYLELCGKSIEEVVGRTCCFAPQCYTETSDTCPSWGVFQEPRSQKVIRRFINEKGVARTFEICASSLQINGKTDQALEVWRDITERTRMEAEMAQSERLSALGLLASGISHEINNPLATMATCLDGLKRRLDEGGLQEPSAGVIGRYLDIIQKEVYRCRDLTGKLVLLSQKSSRVRGPVDMNAALGETLSLLDFEFERRGVRVERRIAPGLPPIAGDEAGLRQVLLNLLLNALQAIGAGGRILVSSRWEGETVKVAIEDDGCGIEAANLAHVFEPFYSARPGGRGTGLGLAVSDQIVRLHGGSIGIRSQPGQGTTATITLPLDGGSANEGPDLRTPR